MRELRYYPNHFHSYWDFETLCASGELPYYSFLEPRYFSISDLLPANDQHPDHNIEDGEELIKWIYEKVRASPKWNQSALIVIYDEHGGMYDHFPTPLNVPNPDGRVSEEPAFNFTRIGIRVPAVIASPWLDKGSVVHKPKGPKPDSEFEHSSVISTLLKVAGVSKHLTKRDEWAGTFDDLFLKRSSPRTDCPNTLPNPPKTTLRQSMFLQQMNDLQRNIVATAAKVGGLDTNSLSVLDQLHKLNTEKEGGEFVSRMMQEFQAKKSEKVDI